MNTESTELLELLPDGLLLVQQGQIAFATLRAAEIMGLSPRRIQGHPIAWLSPDADAVCARVLERRAVVTARDLPWSRPGASRRVSFVGSPGPGPGEVLLLVRPEDQVSDPTQRAAFRRRLEWLDGLAAGMAHEIRNPLGGIRGAAQLLRRDPPAEEVDELTSLIIRETDRIDSIVERLMTLSRPRSLRRGPVALNRLVHDEVALLAAQTPGAERGPVEVLLDLDPSLPETEGDAAQLREVVGNLLRNGWEAARAQLRVRTRVDPLGRLREGGHDRGRALLLSVEDDGEGIEPERVSGLFAPFATTKTGGSGLGLFVARLGVDAHGGELAVEPGPGTGARFDLTLWERLPAASVPPARETLR